VINILEFNEQRHYKVEISSLSGSKTFDLARAGGVHWYNISDRQEPFETAYGCEDGLQLRSQQSKTALCGRIELPSLQGPKGIK
jgi:hypothetical protein